MGGHNWAGHANEELMHPQSVWRVPDVLARANCLHGWQLPPPPHTHYCTYTQPLTHMCEHIAFGYDADPMQPKWPVVWHTVSGLPTLVCAISLTPCCKHLPSCNSANIFWSYDKDTGCRQFIHPCVQRQSCWKSVVWFQGVCSVLHATACDIIAGQFNDFHPQYTVTDT